MQIYTNTVPGGYYRSPGAVATAFAVDCHTDIIAKELKMDPAEFRMKNFLGEGETDAVGQRLKDVRFREVLQGALDAAGWNKAEEAQSRTRHRALRPPYQRRRHRRDSYRRGGRRLFTLSVRASIRARARIRSCANWSPIE